MRIAIAATPEVAIPTIESLLSGPDEISFIITQPDRPAGRGRILTPTPIATWASSHSLNVHKPSNIARTLELVSEVDLLITIGYGVLLPKEILDAPTHGCLNLHFSLLPRWRGAAPVQRAIEAGDNVSGVTVFQLDEGMDTGPTYSMKRFALDDDITSDELFHELSHVGIEAVHEAIVAIKNGTKPIPQPTQGATRALKLSKEEGRIDWSQSADVISRKIRAFTSNPGAWTLFRGSPIKLESPRHSLHTLPSGEVRSEREYLLVGSSTTALEIHSLIPSGKNRMTASAWLNGVRLQPGESFD